MKLAKRFSIESLMGMMASLALLIGVTSMSQACFLAFNQPKVPKEMYKFVEKK